MIQSRLKVGQKSWFIRGTWEDIPMLVHYADDVLFALLALVALPFFARQLGLRAWIAYLNRRENKHKDKAAEEYWRIHQ